jgi:hypothetical protein
LLRTTDRRRNNNNVHFSRATARLAYVVYLRNGTKQRDETTTTTMVDIGWGKAAEVLVFKAISHISISLFLNIGVLPNYRSSTSLVVV